MPTDNLTALIILMTCLILGSLAFSIRWESREEREYREFLEWSARQKLKRPDEIIGGGQ